MKSQHLFNAKNQDDEKNHQNDSEKKVKLKALKESAKTLLENHNIPIKQIWDIQYEIATAEKLLKELKSADEETRIKINKKIQHLKAAENNLRKSHNIEKSEKMIKDKYAEIEKLEKEINPDKKIDFNSPFKL